MLKDIIIPMYLFGSFILPEHNTSYSHKPTDSSFIINGTIEGANINGSKVYLVNETLQKKIDSTEVSENKFTFTGHVKEPIYCNIWFKKSPYALSCFLENTSIGIKIKMDSTDYSFDSLLIKSRGYNQLLQDTLNLLENKYYDSANSLKRLYQQMKSENAPDSKLDSLTTLFSTLTDSIHHLQLSFLTKHLNSCLAPLLLKNIFRDESDLEELKYYFNILPNNIKSTYEGLNIKKRIDFFEQSAGKIGDYAHWFTLQDSDKILVNPLQKAKTNHAYSLIIFWASWCSPCIKEIPDLKKIYNKYHDKTFTMIGISLDTNYDNWKNALLKFNLPWQQVIDKHDRSSVAKKYGVLSIPTSIVVNPTGKIIQKGLRGKKLMRYIDSVLTPQNSY